MAPDIGRIDHQVTYSADAAVQAELRERLEYHGKLKRVLRSTYLDTAELDLYQHNITLRERSTVRKNGELSHSKTEAKVPSVDGLVRTSGSAALAAVADVVGTTSLQPVAVQTKTRRLLFVEGTRLAPDFVVALDRADVEVGAVRSHRYEVEVQIFTSLPWTKQVDAARVERFHRFCQQLEADFGLQRAPESGYEAIMRTASEGDRRDSESYLFEGLTEGAKLRTESLFSSSSQLVVDASHVAVVEHEGLSVVPVAEIFSDPNATFIGFGKPNVFLSLPRVTDEGKPGWEKFAAFMFWRKAAFVADTKGRVQGGVFMELRDLPPDAVPRLREAMRAFEGRKTISCANATGRVMTNAGFTSSGHKLAYKVRPMTLAKTIWDGGLEYDGSAVALRVIRTSTGTVSDHFLGVLRKESTSLFRMVGKIVRSSSATSEGRHKAPVIEARPLAAAPIQSRDEARLLELRVARPTKLAVVLRQQIGDHPIFEARLDPAIADINGPDFSELKVALKAYPGQLDAVSRLKRYVLFSKPVVKTIREHMMATMDSIGRLAAPTLVDMFQAGQADAPFLYNVVITGSAARMTRLENRNDKDIDKANWVLAKHVLLSGYDPDVRYAGEIWVEDTTNGRILHLNDNSGTYKPSVSQANAAARFLQQLTGVEVVLHHA